MKRLLLAFLLFAVPAFGQAGQISSAQSPVVDQSGRPIPGANLAVCSGMATTAASVSSDIATLTMASNPIAAGYYIGGTLFITGFETADAYLNGTWEIYNITSSQIQFQITHANASASTSGSVVQEGGNSQTACLPLATIYTDGSATTTSANPFNADGYGNWVIWATAGSYVIQTYGNSLTTTLRQVQISCPVDGTGCVGSGDPAGNVGDLQEKATSTTFNASPVNCDGTYSLLCFSAQNFAFEGPRPWVDVTAFGAKGDAATNDTTAIQNAINSACTGNYGGTIFFPPGVYVVDQPQSPSTSPVFNLPCIGLDFEGTGVQRSGGSPYNRNPSWIVVTGSSQGASPNSYPVFTLGEGDIVRNLNIQGYNQAVLVEGANIQLDKDSLTSSGTADAYNAPLVILNSFWVWVDGGTLNSGGITDPTLIMGELAASGNDTGLIYIQNIITSGGGFQYIQNGNAVGEGPGNLVFRNITQEDSDQDFLAITEVSTPSIPNIGPITIDQVGQADGVTGQAVLSANVANVRVSGISINHATAGNGGPAIRMTAGVLSDYNVFGCEQNCSNDVVDGSGNPIGNGMRQNNTGWDYVTDTGNDDAGNPRLNTVYTDIGTSNFATPLRLFKAGAGNALTGVDPVYGYMLSDGTLSGYNESLAEASDGNLSFMFVSAYPPTSVAGTATTGGSLAPGTWYYYVASSTASNCTTASALSAPSAISSGVVVGGSNNAVVLTWSAAPSTGATTIAGYCVFRTNSPYYSKFSNTSSFVSGSGTTTYSDTGFSGSLAVAFFGTLVQEGGITKNSLQIGKGAFAGLPSCASGTEGTSAPVTDSTTNTWGATITGSGSDHVLAYCDGTNWTVAAK